MTLWLAETMVMTTLLMVLVLLMRRPVARAFGAQTAYALWLLPALRAVLPVVPGWTPWIMPSDAALVVAPQSGVVGLVSPDVRAAVDAGTGAGTEPDWALMLGLIWAFGALLYAGAQLWRYRRFMRAALRDADPLARIADIEVLVSPAVEGPLAAGIWRRRILLPRDFKARYNADERRLALLHEGAHHDRRDLWANGFGLGVLALHWWNPVAHLAWKAFRADQELACDASVLAGADADARSAYASAVLKSAMRGTPAAACAMNHVSQLKERLTMMKVRDFGRIRMLSGAAVVMTTTLLGLMATASGAQPAPPVPPVPPVVSEVPLPPSPPQAPAPAKRVTIINSEMPDGAPADAAEARKPQRMERRIIIRDDGKTPEEMDGKTIERHIETAILDEERGTVEVRKLDGNRVMIIRRGPDMAGLAAEEAMLAREAQREAAEGLAKARDEIAAEKDMPSDIRKRVLASLDQALADIEVRIEKR